MKSLLQVGGVLEQGVSLGSSYIQANFWPACFCLGCIAVNLTALRMRCQGRSWRQSR